MGLQGAIAPTLGRADEHDHLGRACDALARERPERSARRRITAAQALWGAGLGLAALAAALVAPAPTFAAGAALLGLLFVAAVALRALAAAAAIVPRPRAAEIDLADAPIYTLLCPMRREAESLPGLLAALRRLEYPHDRLEIMLVLEADDLETIAAAARVGAGVEIVLTPPGGPRTKPKALMYALPRARGRFVTVYDAEDRPHPAQLKAALAAFAAGGPGLACVQAPLLIDNARATWIATQFAAEYAILFRQILPLLERLGAPVILGGTSNHFRREALEICGGWDPYNVTEDADIGYRLACDGWRTATIDPPTWEEAPVTLAAWTRQRSRWIKGHVQTWLVLMRDPAGAARALGPAGFWTMQLLLFGGIVSAFAHAPLFGLGVWAAAQGETWPVVCAGLGYGVAGASALIAAVQTRSAAVALAAPTMALYWPLAFPAACLALYELVRAPFRWAKTDHGRSPRATPAAGAAKLGA